MTQEAKIMDGIEFPPDRPQNKVAAFGNGGFIFETRVMIANPELLSAVNQLFEKYKAFENEARAKAIESLEEEVDSLIQGAQQAVKVFEAKKANEFEAMRRHQQATDRLNNANEHHRQISVALADDEGLFTRAQQAERESQLTKAREQIHTAALAESLAISQRNAAIQTMNRSASASAAWEVAARGKQADLKALKRQQS